MNHLSARTSDMARFQIAFLLLGACLIFAMATVALGQGPSTLAHEAVLAPWVDAAVAAQAAEQYALAVELYESVEKDVVRYEEAVEAKGVKRLKPLPVGQTHATNVHLARIAERICVWGEPAGFDLLDRSRNLEGRLNGIRTAMSVPYAAAIQKALPAFQARATKHQKVIGEVEKLLAAGKLEAAEKRLLSVYLELLAMAWWYDGKVVYNTLLPYGMVDGKLIQAISAANSKLAGETILSLRDKATPDFTKLPGVLDAAATALKSAPKAEFAGQSLTGPEIFMETIKRWRQLHESYLRAVAFNLALTPQHDAGAKLSQLTTAATAMRAQLSADLVKLVDADAARTNAAEAATLHAEYLDLAAKVPWISRDREILKGLDAALDRLASKSPTFEADVAAYRGATDDLLRWRNRAADALAKTHREKASKPIATKVDEIQTQPILPERVAKLAEEWVGKEVVVTGAFLNVGKSLRVGGLAKNTLVRIAEPMINITTTLGADLLVDDAHPPLTLAAATAIRGAERGSIVECGGTIASVELIGAIPFLATKTPLQRGAISLGELAPAEIGNGTKPALQLIQVTEINPTWVRGDGYFAEVGR